MSFSGFINDVEFHLKIATSWILPVSSSSFFPNLMKASDSAAKLLLFLLSTHFDLVECMEVLLEKSLVNHVQKKCMVLKVETVSDKQSTVISMARSYRLNPCDLL